VVVRAIHEMLLLETGAKDVIVEVDGLAAILPLLEAPLDSCPFQTGPTHSLSPRLHWRAS
jgi:hypothetical protein